MEESRIIYRVLKAVLAYSDTDEPCMDWFEPERLKTTEAKRDRVVRMLAEEGLITGIHMLHDVDGLTRPAIL